MKRNIAEKVRPKLTDLITETLLRKEAGDRAFERGAGYFRSGAVTDLVVTDETINARIEGSDEYAVQLWNEDGELGYSCTCPVGDDGEFCKHGVAAGLAWLAGRTGAQASSKPKDDLGNIREWIAKAPREKLETLLIEQALVDPGLRSRLDANAARAAAAGNVDAKALKETIGKALTVGSFVDYHGMRRVIERAYPVVELIGGLIDDGYAAATVELAHYALKRGIAAYSRIDDSGGGYGDLLHDIAALHLKACLAVPPEPAAFGKQFFGLVMLDEWGLLDFERYAPLLGDAGLAVFRALAEKEWAKVPARGPEDEKAGFAVEHFRITSIMEKIARHTGDTDGLVAIKSRELTSPYRFLEIAEVLAEAGRRDEALDWAERGQKAFPARSDSRLIEFLADEYGRRGRHDEALSLSWEEFNRHPALASYQRLKVCADRASAWADWRAKALAWIQEEFRKETTVNSLSPRERARVREDLRHFMHPWHRGGHSLLVEIFLWEGDSDAALAEAKTGGCPEHLWFALAHAREKDHPQDAVAIYQARIDNIVRDANNRAYDEATNLIARIRDLMQRTKQEVEFAVWLDGVRVRHKAKRNFMQRLISID